MKQITAIKQVYFIGIGGIGMSALARYFLSKGADVRGYDRTSTPLTLALAAAGMQITYEDEPSIVPTAPDLIVYTPAIPADNRILNYYRDKGNTLYKRSDVLGLISAESFNICIAGTHGKTTVSAMTAHVLRHSGYGCNAFLGGIAANYGTNFWSHERPVTVLEADEYDRSFLKLSPDIAAITAMDPDHLDIYGTAVEMEEAFLAFSEKIKAGGLLFAHSRLSRRDALRAPRVRYYALDDPSADLQVRRLVPIDGGYRYDVQYGSRTLSEMILPMGGLHNVENSLVAIGVALELGIADAAIKAAIADFRGVSRRFEYRFRSPETIYIDDYAHHPEELKALITGARGLFGGRKMTLVFQPHLYSRTRDFADGFAAALDLADEVILLPIYPAREQPLPGVESSLIAGRMKRSPMLVSTQQEVLHWLQHHNVELLITAGAGDIDRLAEPITNQLINQPHAHT